MEQGNGSVGATAADEGAREKQSSAYKAEVQYWRKQHERARAREEQLKSTLKEKEARIRYLEQKLYGRHSEQSGGRKQRAGGGGKGGKRRRGAQLGREASKRREYEELPVSEELYDLPPEEQCCTVCGQPWRVLTSTDESEIVEIEVSAHRRRIKQRKYAAGCSCEGDAGIVSAPGPPRLMPCGRYGISVWVHILVQKYHFQIPVARILRAMGLDGLAMPAGSAGDGIKRLAPLFEPIYAAIEEKSRSAAWWQADETRWSVFERPEGKGNFRWYLWVFLTAESVVHVIDPSRSAQVVEEHLGTVVEGILVVDRYSAYKAFAKRHESVKLAFCWSHVRRDFIEAAGAYPSIAEWANEWVTRIDELFHHNRLRTAAPRGSDTFAAEDRQVRAALEEMRERAEQQLSEKRLHHRKRHVLRSLLNHWEGLVVFVEHPEIPMDNNASERSLRTPVVGRKNYYGSGAMWSARFTAVMLSIFETLELYGINQKEWLESYLRGCAEAGGLTPPEEIEAYLPWNSAAAAKPGKCYRGRVFSAEELELVKRLVEEDTSVNRTHISREACRLIGWRQDNGKPKERSMRLALLDMEAEGRFRLPPPQTERSTEAKPIRQTERTAAADDIFAAAGTLEDLRLELACDKDDLSLWAEYIDRYHYLGYTAPAGASLKYFLRGADGDLGLVGFSSAAWSVADRDAYIGWSESPRRRNLPLVVNNNRFLILPWVHAPNLASKALAMAVARLPDDWEHRYGRRPVLLETFVDAERFAGTCYKAANWIHVGATAGTGRNGKHTARLPSKNIFLYPLTPNFREPLCFDSS